MRVFGMWLVSVNHWLLTEIFILTLLGLLVNTLYLLVNSILIDKKTGRLVRQKLLKAIRGEFFCLIFKLLQ
jgi:hypothetical protein